MTPTPSRRSPVYRRQLIQRRCFCEAANNMAVLWSVYAIQQRGAFVGTTSLRLRRRRKRRWLPARKNIHRLRVGSSVAGALCAHPRDRRSSVWTTDARRYGPPTLRRDQRSSVWPTDARRFFPSFFFPLPTLHRRLPDAPPTSLSFFLIAWDWVDSNPGSLGQRSSFFPLCHFPA
jgi:hypothetical protein